MFLLYYNIIKNQKYCLFTFMRFLRYARILQDLLDFDAKKLAVPTLNF